MGRIFIFDIDDTLILHTKERNDYYNINTEQSFKKLLESVEHNGVFIYTNGTYGHGEGVVNNLQINVDGMFGRDTMPNMKPHINSFNYVKNIIDKKINQNDECIFFDDLLDNLDTAKRIGWSTVWITPNFNNGSPEFVDYVFPNIYQAMIYFGLKK
jgi:FMN phosphatase YigB (HAD superfamily)